MKVCLDISQIAHIGGVGTYTKNLAKHLLNYQDADMVFFYSSLRKPYRGDLPNVKSFSLPPTVFEMVFNRLRVVSIEKFVGKIDIYHSSDWVQAPSQAKKVTTYHDVVPLKYPQWSHPKIVDVQRKRLELVRKEVDKIIAVSEATKKDLIKISGIPQEKIIVIYEGVSDSFKPLPKELVENFRRERNLPEKFVLAIGGVGERRNLARIKKAVTDYSLVITSETIPWVSDEELPLLYNCASVLLYPSLYEGFGLPILDGMACGIPVITSKTSSMPEVGGEAAVYVDPQDTEEIRRKVKEVMEDENLRKDLIKQGFEQAKKFTWEKCASETLAVYKSLMY